MAKVMVKYKTKDGYRTKTIKTNLPTNEHGNILFQTLLDNMTDFVKTMDNEYSKTLWINVLD